jgi:ubiquinone/menaquinone biosynthesis C-methylase UbiE
MNHLETQFHKNLSLLGWEEVKKRQLHRLPLVYEWINLVLLKSGNSVLDIGPGPGVFTSRYAEAVGNTGKVVVLEKSPEAVEYLLEELSQINSKIEIITGDAEEFDLNDIGPFDAIMLTDMLHHTDSPERILKNVYNNTHANDTRILISEFDPKSKGEFGPPINKRLDEHYLLNLLQDIGFKIISSGKQLLEHYYLIVHV